MLKLKPIKRALISVYEKFGILNFAKYLNKNNIEIIATTGTAKFLLQNNIPVINVSDYIKFPELIQGKIKTLHPKIYGGLLGIQDLDTIDMIKYNILPIDIVIVNLYPFFQATMNKNFSTKEILDNIDIGGHAMIRASAKNYHNVVIIVNTHDYLDIISKMEKNKRCINLKTRIHLAQKAFSYIANYDRIIENYFFKKKYSNKNNNETLPNTINLDLYKIKELRYGENNHQKSALYQCNSKNIFSKFKIKQLNGKQLSYNNLVDIDTAIECVSEFSDSACVIVKHENPCSASVSYSILKAYENAYNSDPISAFGGVIAFNKQLNIDVINNIINRQFVEIIIAPYIDKNIMSFIKYKNIILIRYNNLNLNQKTLKIKHINNGILIQNNNSNILFNKLKIVTNRKPTIQEKQDALFCWKIAKFAKSNAIVYGYDQKTIGIGSGQTSRIHATKIANIKAKYSGLSIHGAAMASDAFIPFRDSVDEAAKLGISCIIQPGGSIRDNEIICASNEHNISMIFTNIRHFRH
ncbi:MAG: bifunctional phosphoribosylaminoimidazolecarboxamide formyltransferase/IMP cyclohydrolase [Enterobacterales bacterium]